ncbi:MAG: cytochrome c-type biogenesis protein CcmH [Roseovarius sp.]|jgi:cytochrome c-type biogenesis protein CcmH|uniref:cytochrome c-type biogenesis protein n=1 Tax=Roseovarius sp. TaxID=1486281 RepID=UPI001B4FED61|nr:cytochrome c-type biogenesis protein [Roseovarius sp.]MBQ0749566.1 cytochrome c-type biogenesis protein CcmH [Roseovarius sp.]MBQ0812043.1 cytochrome c-type biogenesis protein CcmH [Roseovarius sp.]
MKRLILALCVIAAPVFAVQPDEILDDPALEARARDISSGLRCLVCRNESIDDSNAELARDLRLLVRERLVAGDSNEEAVDFIVARYGEYVLLKPRSGGANILLWWAGPLMLGAGILIGAVYLRGRARSPETEVARLSEAEEHRLREILKD